MSGYRWYRASSNGLRADAGGHRSHANDVSRQYGSCLHGNRHTCGACGGPGSCACRRNWCPMTTGTSVKDLRCFCGNMTIGASLKGSSGSRVCETTGIVSPCRRSDAARAFPSLFHVLLELQYHALGFNKTGCRMWLTDILSNRIVNGSLPICPHLGVRRPRLPLTAGRPIYGHLCNVRVCLSLMFRGLLFAFCCLCAAFVCISRSHPNRRSNKLKSLRGVLSRRWRKAEEGRRYTRKG